MYISICSSCLSEGKDTCYYGYNSTIYSYLYLLLTSNQCWQYSGIRAVRELLVNDGCELMSVTLCTMTQRLSSCDILCEQVVVVREEEHVYFMTHSLRV